MLHGIWRVNRFVARAYFVFSLFIQNVRAKNCSKVYVYQIYYTKTAWVFLIHHVMYGWLFRCIVNVLTQFMVTISS